ncbi:hypothetical protein KIS4809_4666 [Bacillus sp. ZZV12-4809]|nr:hypothetical protein KIS4809_4666 [Bacillus sp. ZZV12-4809]
MEGWIMLVGAFCACAVFGFSEAGFAGEFIWQVWGFILHDCEFI